MDEPIIQQPMSDDQELAKVLAGVSQQVDEVAPEPIVTTQLAPVDDTQFAAAPVDPVTTSVPVSNELDGIKLEALNELRPLVDKLNVAPEEKFDTYLLLLRSTDDKELIGPAHEAARGIADEARRAQALLDIIKEIDFLSQK